MTGIIERPCKTLSPVEYESALEYHLFLLKDSHFIDLILSNPTHCRFQILR